MYEVERRRKDRARRQLTCEVVMGGRRYAAIVRDASASGIFVQTRAKPPLDSVVEVVFPRCEQHGEMRTEAGVARERLVPPRLKATVPEGLGLELLDPPAALRKLLAEAVASTARSDGEAAALPMRTFRVRVIRRDAPEFHTLTVRSETLAGARARALARVSSSRWKIADIQEI